MTFHCLNCRRALPDGHRSMLCEHCGKEFVAYVEKHQADGGFTLSNAPARPKPATFASAATTQRKLIDGLDCLPGQGDLF